MEGHVTHKKHGGTLGLGDPFYVMNMVEEKIKDSRKTETSESGSFQDRGEEFSCSQGRGGGDERFLFESRRRGDASC